MIETDLRFSVQSLQWVPSAYLLTYGGFLLLGGRLADLLGRRRLLVVLTSEVSWRWVFFVNLPMVAVILAASFRLVDGERPKAPPLRRFDTVGAGLITGGMLLLVYVLVNAPNAGWGTARTLGELAGGVALIVLFLFNEHLISPSAEQDSTGYRAAARARRYTARDPKTIAATRDPAVWSQSGASLIRPERIYSNGWSAEKWGEAEDGRGVAVPL